ncbi:hypothetical protein [Sedimentitalea sp.]|uniref:hypothetical protein n=1 Tax=Sedimentitalea sp. TaxID=2048915 RepID=UPI003296FFED
MATAALDSSGVVDFKGDGAKEALADLDYHPSSLLTPTPILDEQVQSVVGLFTEEHSAKDAALIMKAATAPANKVAGGIAGKDSDGAEGTQKAVREAVLAAMMTPMTQGPVGSCFATAPARKQQREAPLDYMRGLTEIASKRTFIVPGQPNIPAAPAETI